MHDQADELRQLVLRSAASARVPVAPPPPMVVVSGGKGGVGTTTIAVNLAVVLARLGRRVVLVDADLHQPDATALCHLNETDSLIDVLVGRRTVHEVLQPGPAGIQVLPGAWAPQTMAECSPLAQQRMLAELRRLGLHADIIVIDAGSSPDPVTGRFWQAADLVLLVTTTDSAAIMDSYAAIKLLAAGEEHPPAISTLVNQSTDPSLDADVHLRIGQACQRFLNLEIGAAPAIPLEHEVALAGRACKPLVTYSPHCAAVPALESLAEHVLGLVGSGNRRQATQTTKRTGAA